MSTPSERLEQLTSAGLFGRVPPHIVREFCMAENDIDAVLVMMIWWRESKKPGGKQHPVRIAFHRLTSGCFGSATRVLKRVWPQEDRKRPRARPSREQIELAKITYSKLVG